MDASEIRAKIRSREGAIYNHRIHIKNFKSQIDDLKALTNRLNKLQGELEDVQAMRKERLCESCACTINTVIIGRYYDGMDQELRNRSYQAALGGMDDARNKIVIEIRDCNAEISELEIKIRKEEKAINELKKMLKNVPI